ncbi:ATP-dependent 6-phosphofructokinase [Desulfobotulus sp. H1]|uniref:ATP-dependent 6-phosphofructokinase n=1 Tax=Desulfobotulus pelophilus TaxID=2823377 RepID=A0ABT3N534_9BACT|nr:ATP-dependent 6-phosphofructokinase [Desulfobotulus pelophilus]MCW7752571.1 ATP-dependent 6-phosphofructokinase [Desulfobotulus pelophilus]
MRWAEGGGAGIEMQEAKNEMWFEDTRITNLENQPFASPLRFAHGGGFVADGHHILYSLDAEGLVRMVREGGNPLGFEAAGPRERIHFAPSEVRAAIVTCGGLCPGLNDIIRSLVIELYHRYGVRRILGVPFGLQGLIGDYGYDFRELNPLVVERILDMGGTILGSSRGPQDFDRICDRLEKAEIHILFMVGGDGTLTAAHLLSGVVRKRGLDLAVVGIPKTIDNDIAVIERSFGFDTAVEEATRAIRSAHTEAVAYPNGIGMIRLMGRHSGFIAATAALAQQDANFVLIPEVPFELEGEMGLLASLERRLAERGHAVIVVAEGAGQNFFTDKEEAKDASGNRGLKDIGLFLKEAIEKYFALQGRAIAMKYIDPSYMIRSRPANAGDSVFCSFLARNAVHAAMAGKTDMLVGYVNGTFVHLPLALCAGKRRHVDPGGLLWQAVLETTGQGELCPA